MTAKKKATKLSPKQVKETKTMALPKAKQIEEAFLESFSLLASQSTADLRDVARFATERAAILREHVRDVDFREQVRLAAGEVALHGATSLTDIADKSDETVQNTLMTSLSWAARFAPLAVTA